MRTSFLLSALLTLVVNATAQSSRGLELKVASGSAVSGPLSGLDVIPDGRDGLAVIKTPFTAYFLFIPIRKGQVTIDTFHGPKLRKGKTITLPRAAEKAWTQTRMNADDVRTLNVFAERKRLRFERFVVDRGTQRFRKEPLGSFAQPAKKHRMYMMHTRMSPSGTYTMVLSRNVVHEKLMGVQVTVLDSLFTVKESWYVPMPFPLVKYRFDMPAIDEAGHVTASLRGIPREKGRPKKFRSFVVHGGPGPLAIEEVVLGDMDAICAAAFVAEDGTPVVNGLAWDQATDRIGIFTQRMDGTIPASGGAEFLDLPEPEIDKLLFSAKDFKLADRDIKLDEEDEEKDDLRERFRLLRSLVPIRLDRLPDGDHEMIAEVRQDDVFCTDINRSSSCTPTFLRGNLLHIRLAPDGTVKYFGTVSKLYRSILTDVMGGLIALYDGDTMRLLFNEYALANRVGREQDMGSGGQEATDRMKDSEVVTSCYTFVPGYEPVREHVPELSKKGNWLFPEIQVRYGPAAVISTLNSRSGGRFVRLEVSGAGR